MGRSEDEQRDDAPPSATPEDLQLGEDDLELVEGLGDDGDDDDLDDVDDLGGAYHLYQHLGEEDLSDDADAGDDDDAEAGDDVGEGADEGPRLEDLQEREDRLSDDQVARTEDQAAAKLADRVNRLVEDEKLLAQLRETGFVGSRADLLRDELIRYGWSVLNAFMYSGTIFRHANRMRRPVSCSWELRELLRSSVDDRADIACELVARVLPRFWEDALVRGGWRRDGGAKITTYFTNALLLEFSNVFRVWQRQQRPLRVDEADLTYEVSPEREADERRMVLEKFRKLKPREQRIVALHYDKYSHAEIVELTGARSVDAVEGVLYRWRCKQPGYREHREQGGGGQ